MLCVVTLQQLLDRLRCFPVRPAVLPTILSDQPEDQQEEVDEEAEAEPAEDLEMEELMRSMASKLSPSARYHWRRSRWLRYCPVALADGNMVPGKTEFTVSYDFLFLLTTLLLFSVSRLLFIQVVIMAKRMIPLLRGQRQAHSPSAGTAESQMPSPLSWGIGRAATL